MSCHEDAALWLVRCGSPRPLIGWHGVTPGCRVTRLMLIITVGSQFEFVIVTLTRGRHGKWEGNSPDIPPTLTDYFCMCDSIFHWNLHFSIHPESDCKFTPGSYFCVSPARDRRLIMRTLLCHLSTPTLEMISGSGGWIWANQSPGVWLSDQWEASISGDKQGDRSTGVSPLSADEMTKHPLMLH